MSDLNDNNTSDAASRTDALISAIRAALDSDASPAARSTGADACRAILRGLEPLPQRNGTVPPGTPAPTAGTPLGAALSALGSIPREQILDFLVTGLRALMSQGAPTYHVRSRPEPASSEGPHHERR